MTNADLIADAFQDELRKLAAGQVPFVTGPQMAGSPGGLRTKPPIIPPRPKRGGVTPAVGMAPASQASPVGMSMPGGA